MSADAASTSASLSPDPRRHAWRRDLADARLRGQVEATHFIDPQTAQVARTTPMFSAPDANTERATEVLAGAQVDIYEQKNGWAWVQIARDRYVGYIDQRALAPAITFATHRILSPRAFVFEQPDFKSPVRACMLLGEELIVSRTTGAYLERADGGFLHERTTRPLADVVLDPVALAERFTGTPYLWGGSTALGIDCSGLVQAALHAAGLECPRDSDMQQAELGRSIGRDARSSDRQRGDLVFWKGHVGILTDPDTLLHANVFHMETASEPLAEAITRIAADGSPVTDIRRPAYAEG